MFLSAYANADPGAARAAAVRRARRLGAYNAGEGAVLEYKRRIPPYEETQDYVQLVIGRYQQLRG